MRVVADTNVLISAFVFPGGPPERVYRSAIEGRIQLITSSPLLLELGRVLTGKFDRPHEAAQVVSHIATIADIVAPEERVSVIAEDPADDRVLEAGAEGHADAIVTGDRHLLRLKRWREIRIITATKLLEELEAPRPPGP